MGDLRQILAQGRKRIGILLGAGAPASLRIDKAGKICEKGKPLIPTIDELTQIVMGRLDANDSAVVNQICKDLGDKPNIEMILSRIRSLSEYIGCNVVYGNNGFAFKELSKRICESIGEVVGPSIPKEGNPYTELVSWVGGIDRKHPIEVFTPNYDLLLEETLERLEIPYFDGFSGSVEPFFDPASISNDDLPPRWVRLWKLHGSLGWATNERGKIVRGRGRSATQLIYPDHLKYTQIQKLPFTAFFDRLRKFLITPDTLLLTCGFSFSDAHIVAVIDEALAANPAGSVFAFQYGLLDEEPNASALACKRPNMSVYARDGAFINCIPATWVPGELPTPNWESIRSCYWVKGEAENSSSFLLGNFKSFARFVSLIHAERLVVPDETTEDEVKK